MIGNTRSTPTPFDILRTVKVSPFALEPLRWITTPWNCWIRSLFPSFILTWTFTVSPALKAGMVSRTFANSCSTILIRSAITRWCFWKWTANVGKESVIAEGNLKIFSNLLKYWLSDYSNKSGLRCAVLLIACSCFQRLILPSSPDNKTSDTFQSCYVAGPV